MSMFGWKDSGGGTIFPRQIALELQKRGHEVMVIYSAVQIIEQAPMYSVQEHSEDGVKLIGIHNRPAHFLDDKNPRREINDPNIVAIFKHYFESFQPDLVHYHNFLGLSLGIAEVAALHQLPSYYTPYNFWLLCPTLYLNLPDLSLCQGVNTSGSNCLNCTRASLLGSEYVQRRDTLRDTYLKQIGTCLASSESVRNLMLANGYPSDAIEIIRFGNERSQSIWQAVGIDREPGVSGTIQIGFTGSLVPIKGVHNLVAAVQMLQGDFKLNLYGEGPEEYVAHLKQLDAKGIVNFYGRFSDQEHSRLLGELDLAVVPSVCFDHSPLVIGEFQAARVPVIGARIGGIPDYIQPETGALYEPENISQLAAILQDLINHPEQIEQWQSRIQEPLSFDGYVDLLEARYHQAHLHQAQQQIDQTITRFLHQRGKTVYYQAQTLSPLQATQPPFGLDIWTAQQVQDLQNNQAQDLQTASWITVAQTALQADLQAAGLKAHFLAPWPPQSGSNQAAFELLTDKKLKVLLPVQADSQDWQPLVASWLQHVPEAQDAALILLPWQSEHDVCQDQVQDFLEAFAEEHQIDLEQTGEMLLIDAFDPAQHQLADILAQCEIAVLGPELLKQAVAWQFLQAEQLLAPQLDSALQDYLKAAAIPTELTNCLQALANWQIYQPDQDALQALEQANQMLLKGLLRNV